MEAQGEASGLPFNQNQVHKAIEALLAYNANKLNPGENVMWDEDKNVFLMITVSKIPQKEQMIKINLPHRILPDTSEVCLFTKDEPGLTAEQTENMYRKRLDQHGITSVTEIISYKRLKIEYKSFQAKCRLLNRFALILSDHRVRRLLPSQMGKYFYQRKKVPLCVNLKAKDLAKEINKRIHGTTLPISNKGCCYMVRIGRRNMDALEITENAMAAAEAISFKAPQVWKNVKVLHLKTSKSFALPIFHAALQGGIGVPQEEGAENQKHLKYDGKILTWQLSQLDKTVQRKTNKANPKATFQKGPKASTSTAAPAAEVPKPDKVEPPAPTSKKEEEKEEDIPQLVPIETQPPAEKDQVAELKLDAKPQLKKSPPKLPIKRKAEIPISQPETPGETSTLAESNPEKPGPKTQVAPQELLQKTQSEDVQPPLAKPTVAPKRLKTP